MSSHEDGGRDLGVLLDDIEAASKLPAKRRKISIKSTVEDAASILFDRGALPEELARIVDLLAIRNHLDQSSLGSLVRNLYPARKVSDGVALSVVGALGHGQHKPSLALQSLLLRWLVMVYHLLEKTAILSQAYGVLFNLLDTAAIRPQLCHLLALVTRRKHVRPFRIQAILTLSRQTGSDPALVGLLRVFKNYYPEIIVGESTKGRAAAFKHPDPQWRERLEEIRRQNAERYDDGVRNGFAVNHALARQMKGAKLTGVPAVRTQHAQEESITLEEVDNPEFFAENLEKIELPTQLVAILADPLLQKLMLLRPDAEGFSRVSYWLAASMNDIASGDADPSSFLDLVDIIHEYTTSTKNLPPLLIGLFRAFFQVWDGQQKRDTVLEALGFAPLQDFHDAYAQLFGPLERSLLDNTLESQVALLNFYTRLLRRWTVALQAKDDLNTLPKDSIHNLIDHVNNLALTLTQTSPSVPTYLAILEFYHFCASLFSQRPILLHVEITIPPAFLIYILFFSGSLPTMARLGGVLAEYKRSWEAVMAPPAMRALSERERKQINTFNGFLMDLCNCIWRGRAFSTSDLNAQGCRIPRTLPPVLESYLRGVDSDLALSSAFGLSHSPVLCLQAIAHVRELEDEVNEIRARHAGPVTQASLGQLANRGGLQLAWQEYRVGVLQHLEENGFEGVSELMYNTMKNLAKAKQ
ncbi:centromere protein I [Podospora aff. communis PSN243]|uniref:Centromere protein I n=1 Tax=Podospora aff. communis PSN243 TaxID=3040156 RepID=A0AAV9GW22_9PEZI|nr:centromere protein I [Podospora aff. communis PSN243]